MLEKVKGWVRDIPAKLRVLVGAWPAWAAMITLLLGVAGDEIVPRLPGGWPVQVGGWIAGALVFVGVVSAVVARVTPVLFPQNRGLLADPPAQSPTEPARPGVTLSSTANNVTVYGEQVESKLPPVDPSAYPPGSERLPHRRPT